MATYACGAPEGVEVGVGESVPQANTHVQDAFVPVGLGSAQSTDCERVRDVPLLTRDVP